MNPAHCIDGFARGMLRLAAALLAAGAAACAQAPQADGSPPAPAPTAPAPAPEAGAVAPAPAPAPKLRGIKPVELPREEPGVGLGGLTHEPAQPAQ